jgi:DNA-binding LytR/AlgR family response regulator
VQNTSLLKKNKSLKVLIEDIIYIEVEGVIVILPRRKFVIMMSLTKMLELLDPSKFSRTQELCGKLGKIENNI